MTREVIAAALMVWLIGVIVGWCAGWAARGEQNRGWHRGVVRQLAQARADLAQTLDQLDAAHARWDAQVMVPPGPAVVHVHVAAPLPWAPPPHAVIGTAGVLDVVPVVPAEGVRS